MLRRLWLIFAQACTVGLALLWAYQAWQTRGPRPAEPLPPSVTDARPWVRAAEQAAPAVVALRSTDDNGPDEASMGSGVIIDDKGTILTNHHVVRGAQTIQVQLADGRQAVARVMGSDPETDLALLQTDLRPLPQAHWGDSAQLKVGEPVLAIGNPFGVGQTVTAGIVSALQRKALGINVFESFIQTDAAINPGNSGGALINQRGELVGIPSAIYSRNGGHSGLGFAIPADLAQSVIQSLRQHGRVTRGWLGVQTRPLTPELAQALKIPPGPGVVVSAVVPHSPAASAAVRTGDVIQSVGDRSIQSPEQLLEVVAALAPGLPTVLHLRRGEQWLTLAWTVGLRPRPAPLTDPTQD